MGVEIGKRLLQLLIPCSIMESMSAHLKPTPLKFCNFCEKKLERKHLPNGDLEYLIHFNRRKYCNQTCMGQAFDARPSKSTDWSTTHYHARKLVPRGPCVKCRTKNASDVHHKDGNHTNNTTSNLERICRSCHVKEHRKVTPCVICGSPQKGLGYCDKHYQRFKKHGDPFAYKTPPRKMCRMCSALAHSNNLCGKHYMQWKRGTLGQPQRTKREVALLSWKTRRLQSAD